MIGTESSIELGGDTQEDDRRAYLAGVTARFLQERVDDAKAEQSASFAEAVRQSNTLRISQISALFSNMLLLPVQGLVAVSFLFTAVTLPDLLSRLSQQIQKRALVCSIGLQVRRTS